MRSKCLGWSLSRHFPRCSAKAFLTAFGQLGQHRSGSSLPSQKNTFLLLISLCFNFELSISFSFCIHSSKEERERKKKTLIPLQNTFTDREERRERQRKGKVSLEEESFARETAKKLLKFSDFSLLGFAFLR